MEEILIYSVGIASMSACVLKSTETPEIEKKANGNHPTGISSRWEIAEEDHFADGEPMPCQCDTYDDRQHWLLHC